MTLTIDLTPEIEERLNSAARRAGVEPAALARQLIESLPANARSASTRNFTARELLRLPNDERAAYLRAAAERAAPEYEADLARPLQERELTAFSGADFHTGLESD